jgi:uncharacterized protein YaaR (DUF327 family)
MNLDVEFDEIETPKKETKKTKAVKEKTFSEVLDDLDEEYGGKSCSFVEVENIGKTMLRALPKLNFTKLRNEMSHMHVNVFENPTTFQLTEAMAQVQVYKNRLAEIMTLVEHEYITRKRVNDILFDANQAISKQSSADKRKGEATLRFPTLLMKFSEIESFRYEVNSVMNNIRSIGDTISRQTTVMQMQINLGEYRKKTAEDFRNRGEGEDPLDYKSGAPQLFDESPIKEQSWTEDF